jgi:hypothetical protein
MPETRKIEVTIRLGAVAHRLIQQIDRNCSVEEIIERICDHVQQGVYRPGAWERPWLVQCVGDDFEGNLQQGDPYALDEAYDPLGLRSPFQKPRIGDPDPEFLAHIKAENRRAAQQTRQAVKDSTEAAIRQLKKSERGQATCKLLFAFLNSETVKGLDGFNQDAVHALVTAYMRGNGSDAYQVMTALRDVARPMENEAGK